MSKRWTILVAAFCVLVFTSTGTVQSQTLTMGMNSQPTSFDPHFHNFAPNSAFLRHIFDGLVKVGADNRLEGSLAESWERTSDTVWRVKLRQGVRFHDGSPFTAADVAFTFKRIPNVPNSPATFAGQLKNIADLKIVDAHTIELVTKKPVTTLMSEMINVLIISQKYGETATTEDYNAGRAMIGTGPYKFVSSRAGEQMTLVRNDDYWGPKEPWAKVDVRVLTNSAARIAALLSGDVDLIDGVMANDIVTIKRSPGFKVTEGVGAQTVFVTLNVAAETSVDNDATDANDKPLAKNPVRDPRVRQALSMAIDRPTLIRVALGGGATAASQLVSNVTFGYDPGIAGDPYDVAGAKKLLAEAGYPNGFKAVLHASDNGPNMGRVAQTIAQMWSQAGVPTTIDMTPQAIFIARSTKGEFLFMVHSWGNLVNESSYAMAGVVMSRDPKAGTGTSNRSGYANPDFDKMVQDAIAVPDMAARQKKLQEAMRLVSNDRPILPLFYPTFGWAAREGIAYTPLITREAMAMQAKPASK